MSGASEVPPRVPPRDDDRGASLVELLVYSLLLVVVLAVVGSMVLQTVVSQRDVRAVTEANGAAQQVSASVEGGVRSAAAIQYTLLDGGHERLIVRTRMGTAGHATWQCQGWFYDASARTLSTKRVAAADGASTALQVAATDATWTVLSDALTGSAPGGRVFVPGSSGSPTTVHLGFLVGTGTRKPVAISTSISRRPQATTQEWVGAPCFL